jgi:2-polyprenyl-6-methoxyphenol hydroxylase-like FAD-dependent oxidoreductase
LNPKPKSLGGADHRVSVEMRPLNTRYPFMLVLPQQQTEQILANALKSHGAETEWGSAVSGVERSADDVVATVERDDGSGERVRARYLIGRDGAHSSIRRLVNLPFEGDQLSELVLIGDVKVDRTFVRSQ